MQLIMKASDSLKKELTYIVYEPCTPDGDDQWMSAETVEKAKDDFNKHYFEDGDAVSNLFHLKDEEGLPVETDSFEITKSWTTPVECQIGDQEVREGTWLAVVKVKNDVLWDLWEEGEVGGLSLHARGKVGQND